jgi:antitoxin FitA
MLRMKAYRGGTMATLTVRNLDADIVKRLRIRAAEHGRSAEAEHREILRAALAGVPPPSDRREALDRLAEFRKRLAGREAPSILESLDEARSRRIATLMREPREG